MVETQRLGSHRQLLPRFSSRRFEQVSHKLKMHTLTSIILWAFLKGSGVYSCDGKSHLGRPVFDNISPAQLADPNHLNKCSPRCALPLPLVTLRWHMIFFVPLNEWRNENMQYPVSCASKGDVLICPYGLPMKLYGFWSGCLHIEWRCHLAAAWQILNLRPVSTPTTIVVTHAMARLSTTGHLCLQLRHIIKRPASPPPPLYSS